jgi:hypothetical protein
LTLLLYCPCFVRIQISDSVWSCWVDQIHNTQLEYIMDACLMIGEHGECYCSSCLMIGEHGECYCSPRFKTTCISSQWENGWYTCVYCYHWGDISDIHVFIIITGSISLISMCVLLTQVDFSDIHVFITITRSISLISMCLLLSLGRYLGYPCVYYYH